MAGLGSLAKSLGSGNRKKDYIDALKANLGDSLWSGHPQPIREAEILAIAKVFSDLNQVTRRVLNEMTPGGSSQGLTNWAERLHVQILNGDSASLIRGACAGKYKAQLGGSSQNIIDSIEATMGDSLVEVLFNSGPSTDQYTYWEGVNPGSSIDLGGDSVGEFSSIRSHVLITIRVLPGETVKSTEKTIKTKLTDVLDSLLPAYATWAYQISSAPYQGFILDVSPLDITAL